MKVIDNFYYIWEKINENEVFFMFRNHSIGFSFLSNESC